MDVAERCIVCHDNDLANVCNCKKSITRFFELLLQVNERCRISSQKQTSEFPQFQAMGGIDKLTFLVTNPNQILLDRIRKAPIMNIGLWVYKLGENVFIDQKNLSQPLFITNPNKFSDLKTYFSFIRDIIGSDSLEKTKITRLDLNLDFNIEYEVLIQSFNVKNKCEKHEFIQGVRKTGIRSGKGSEEVEIYDKGLKDNLTYPLTRIEIRLRGKKIPFRNLKDLECNFLSRISESTIFKNVELLSTQIQSQENLPASLVKKAIIAEEVLKNDGYINFRQKFNKNGNFDREIRRIAKTVLWEKQPKQLYLENIQKFINKNSGG